jgi:hypothetical protein
MKHNLVQYLWHIHFAFNSRNVWSLLKCHSSLPVKMTIGLHHHHPSYNIRQVNQQLLAKSGG